MTAILDHHAAMGDEVRVGGLRLIVRQVRRGRILELEALLEEEADD